MKNNLSYNLIIFPNHSIYAFEYDDHAYGRYELKCVYSDDSRFVEGKVYPYRKIMFQKMQGRAILKIYDSRKELNKGLFEYKLTRY